MVKTDLRSVHGNCASRPPVLVIHCREVFRMKTMGDEVFEYEFETRPVVMTHRRGFAYRGGKSTYHDWQEA